MPRSRATPTLVIHGGAGLLDPSHYPPERIALYREALREALLAGHRVLTNNGNALDASVAAVLSMEECPLFNASKGAVFNIAGKHELEASVAVSIPPKGSRLPQNRRGAAVTLLKHVKHPILLAKELYLDEQACPHAFLSGEDAELIAIAKKLDMVDEHYFDTKQRWKEHERGLDARHLTDGFDKPPSYYASLPQGTVGAVALDADGMLACATSTGGKTNKNVGRIGDTPSMGAGFFCASWQSPNSLWQRVVLKFKRSGGTRRAVAVSGTGDGDYFIRNSTAYAVASRMQLLNETVKKSSEKVIRDLKTQEGDGGLIALDERDALPLNCSGMFRGVIDLDTSTPKVAVWATDALEEV